jgi:heterodisulfide reductase subunit C
MTKESFGLQDYLKEIKFSDARTKFRLRSNMTKVKMNMKSDPKLSAELWKCSGCSNLNSHSHIMWCPSFAPVREGLNVSNEVFKIRERIENDDESD